MLPILALTLSTLVGFLALSIDVGMLGIAKTQAQQAVDLASLTAARTLNGVSSSNYNQPAATTNAQNILTYNVVLGQALKASQLSLTYGSYDYNQTTQLFNANFPATAGQPYSAVAATLTTSNMPVAFASIFGIQLLPNVTATAQAVHRPRDIALSMDLSGSMRLGTCLGYDFTPTSRSTNNPDTVVPTFGPYSSSSAVMQGPSTNRTSSFDSYTITPSNTTAANASYSLTYVNSFYQNAANASTLVRAFDSYSSSDGGNTWTAPTSATPQLPPSSYATLPGGDAPLSVWWSATTYTTDVKDLGINTFAGYPLWELDGYASYNNGALDTSNGGYPTVWNQVDYSNSICQFNGYTQGPGYYGETFFIWPPDPRNGAISGSSLVKSWLTSLGMNSTDATTLSNNWATYQSQGMTTGLSNLRSWLSSKGYTTTSPYVTGTSKAPLYYAVCRLFNRAYPAGTANGAFTGDWRVRFFGTNDNTKLYNTSNGQMNVPSSSTYTVNYNAILTWVAQTPNPLPTQLRAGRIKYYGSIPTAITGTWPNYGSNDQRFWVEFIDYALGFRQTASGVYQDVSAMAGYGADFTWGTNVITAPPTAPQSIGYTDNPDRPLLRFWFGALNMVDYLQSYNMDNNVGNYFYMQPGDCYEAPSYTAKQAFVAAVNTMETNHPNDWVTIAPYSWPRYQSNGPTGRFNCVRSPLGTNYNYATASILFPFSTINTDGSSNNSEITPYTADPATGSIPSADFTDVPRGDGDTSFAMALMLCYNQFAVTPTADNTLRGFVTSSPITFPSGMAGGLGRKGAQKVVIFETDGLPNCSATANLVSGGTYNYYKIRYNMNSPWFERISIDQRGGDQRSQRVEPDLLIGDAAWHHLRDDQKPVPALRHRLRSRVSGSERLGGAVDVANHAILRGDAIQHLDPVAEQSDYLRNRFADVDRHDQCLYQYPSERRADRADQVIMTTMIAEFDKVSKTYRAPLRPVARFTP